MMHVESSVSEALRADKVCCVFVLFYPKRDFLETLALLSAHNYTLVVVSNGIDDNLRRQVRMIPNVQMIDNAINLGLATALNQGIKKAFLNPYVDYVALFDQDSKPDKDLPRALAAELGSGLIACVGPKLKDLKSKNTSYGRHNRSMENGDTLSIPTSGTVMTRSAFELVGPMKDELFIDGIDHEWCLRAQTKGLEVRVSEKLSMHHDMGDDEFNWFGEYKPLYKNPVRHFYIVRNSIYLSLYRQLPIRWRLVELVKTLRRVPVYLWFSNDRVQSFKLISRAIVDGVMGRLGPLSKGVS